MSKFIDAVVAYFDRTLERYSYAWPYVWLAIFMLIAISSVVGMLYVGSPERP